MLRRVLDPSAPPLVRLIWALGVLSVLVGMVLVVFVGGIGTAFLLGGVALYLVGLLVERSQRT